MLNSYKKVCLGMLGICGSYYAVGMGLSATVSGHEAQCLGYRSNPKLIGAQVFFRHGARTPLQHANGIDESVFHGDKWLVIDEKTNIPLHIETLDGDSRPVSIIEQKYQQVDFKEGMGAGQLTSLGRNQSYELGQILRKRYLTRNKLVNAEYEENNILTRSTNVNRCIQSLQCVVAGMYEKENVKKKLRVRISPIEEEILFPNHHFCSTLKELKMKNSKIITNMNGYKFLAHYIKYFTGDKSDEYVDLMNYRDHYVSRKSHGKEVPMWLEAVNAQVQAEAAKIIAIESTGVRDNHFVFMPLSIGPMFNMIQHNLKAMITKEKGKHCPKLHLYSGHDTTLVPLLVGLGIYTDVWPPYSSYLAIELYEDNKGKNFVKVVFNDQDIVLPSFEDPMMTIEEFKDVLSPYIVSKAQYVERCNNIETARESAKYWG